MIKDFFKLLTHLAVCFDKRTRVRLSKRTKMTAWTGVKDKIGIS